MSLTGPIDDKLSNLDFTNEISESTQELLNLCKELANEIDNLKKDNREKSALIFKLSKDFDGLKQELDEAREMKVAQHDPCFKELRKGTAWIKAGWQKMVEENDRHIAERKEESETYRRNENEYIQKIGELSGQLEGKSERMAQLEENLIQQTKKCKESDMLVVKITEQMEVEKRRRVSLEKELDKFEGQNSKTYKNIQRVEENIYAQLDTFGEKLDLSAKDRKKFDESIKQANSRIEKEKNLRINAEDKLKESEIALIKERKAISDLQEKNSIISLQLQSFDKDKSRLETLVTALNDKLQLFSHDVMVKEAIESKRMSSHLDGDIKHKPKIKNSKTIANTGESSSTIGLRGKENPNEDDIYIELEHDEDGDLKGEEGIIENELGNGNIGNEYSQDEGVKKRESRYKGSREVITVTNNNNISHTKDSPVSFFPDEDILVLECICSSGKNGTISKKK